MAEQKHYELIVVGGGPAGYVAAIRAAQLGKTVAVVERERPGGTCLNWGCIPTKALLKNAEFYNDLQNASQLGIEVKGASFDFAKIIERSRGVSDRMAKGIEFLFKSKKVTLHIGQGVIHADKSVVITGEDGKSETITGDAVLIATGCLPRELPGIEVDGKRVHTSRTILECKTQPKSLVVIGAGAIGVEFSYFLNAFGTKVTLIEMLPRLLPIEDDEVSETLKRSFEKSGIRSLVETKVDKTEVTKKGVKLTVSGAVEETIEADALLVSIGVRPNLDGLLADGLELALDRGYIKTDSNYMSSVEGIYAAGDIIGPPWLAHVASHEAIECVEGLFVKGKKPHKVDLFPGCTYCQPQVASIGLTEAKAKEAGKKFTVARFPYTASGKAVASNHTTGFVKLIIGEKHKEILGAHIIGDNATELIAELGLAMNLEATLDELITTIHAHPTLSEMVHEAALAGLGRPIHV